MPKDVWQKGSDHFAPETRNTFPISWPWQHRLVNSCRASAANFVAPCRPESTVPVVTNGPAQVAVDADAGVLLTDSGEAPGNSFCQRRIDGSRQGTVAVSVTVVVRLRPTVPLPPSYRELNTTATTLTPRLTVDNKQLSYPFPSVVMSSDHLYVGDTLYIEVDGAIGAAGVIAERPRSWFHDGLYPIQIRPLGRARSYIMDRPSPT